MKRLSLKSDGFTVVEFALVIVTLAIIGVAGYFVAKHVDKNKPIAATTTASTTKAKSTTATTKTANPYAGWKSYTTAYEKISFNYPSNWTLKDTSLSESQINSDLAPINCTLDSGTDVVLLTSPNGGTLGIATGQECHSGAQEGNYVGYTPITVLGGKDYIAYETSPTDNSSIISATVSTSSTVGYDYPLSKNITGSSQPWDQFTYTFNGTINPNVGEPLATFESDPDLTTAKLILESMKFE